MEKRLNTNQPHLSIMQLTFEENRNLWKFIVSVGFAACGIFLINEIFMTSDNIMNWMIKTMETGVVRYDELAQKAYLLGLIPGVGMLEFIRKKVSS